MTSFVKTSARKLFTFLLITRQLCIHVRRQGSTGPYLELFFKYQAVFSAKAVPSIVHFPYFMYPETSYLINMNLEDD